MTTAFPPSPDEFPLNPYEAPKVEVSFEPIDLDGGLESAEAIRRDHIKREASIKGLGALVIFGSIMTLIGSVTILGMGVSGVLANDPNIARSLNPGFLYGAGAFGLAMGILLFFVGRGLRRFQPWARWTETGICILNMITINPFVILLSAYFLYILLSAKGGMVFSPEYKTIIEKTPHIKYKTSRLLIGALIFFITIIVIAVIAGIIGALNSQKG